MIIKENKYHNYLLFASVLLILIPPALISGPFLPDLFIVLVSLIFLFILNKHDQLSVLKSNFFRLFIIFCDILNWFSNNFDTSLDCI